MQKCVFLGFCEESVNQLVNQKVIRLDAIASNLEQRGTDRPVGQPVECSSYQLLYPGTKQSTSWDKRSTGWLTSSMNSVLRELFRSCFEAQVVQLFRVDLMA